MLAPRVQVIQFEENDSVLLPSPLTRVLLGRRRQVVHGAGPLQRQQRPRQRLGARGALRSGSWLGAGGVGRWVGTGKVWGDCVLRAGSVWAGAPGAGRIEATHMHQHDAAVSGEVLSSETHLCPAVDHFGKVVGHVQPAGEEGSGTALIPAQARVEGSAQALEPTPGSCWLGRRGTAVAKLRATYAVTASAASLCREGRGRGTNAGALKAHLEWRRSVSRYSADSWVRM